MSGRGKKYIYELVRHAERDRNTQVRRAQISARDWVRRVEFRFDVVELESDGVWDEYCEYAANGIVQEVVAAAAFVEGTNGTLIVGVNE